MKPTKDLKKDDLVITEYGLAWYEEYTKSSEHHRYLLVHNNEPVWYNFYCQKATRSDVEKYIKSLGWVYYTNSYVYEKEGNQFEVAEFDTGEYRISGNLSSENFDTAPAQLAEAILVAGILNATKE